MEKYNVNTQKFRVVSEASEAVGAATELSVPEYVIKAQIHAGGRGKGTFDSGLKGGVHLTKELVYNICVCDVCVCMYECIYIYIYIYMFIYLCKLCMCICEYPSCIYVLG